MRNVIVSFGLVNNSEGCGWQHAKTYYVWYKAAGDSNHTDSVTDCIKVSMASAPASTYSYISGAGSALTKNSGLLLSFHIVCSRNDAQIDEKCEGIEVDKVKAGEENYNTKSGSVIIKLKPTYLETPKIGERTLRVNFTDGYAETTFTILSEEKAVSLPQTGDKTNLFLWATLGSIGLAGMIAWDEGKQSEHRTP